MNNDRISNTPGGEQMLMGGIVFGLSLLCYQAFQYSLGTLGQLDIPIREGNYEILHEIEDALIEFIRNSKSVEIDLHSIDKANNMGTINLRGRDADAMFAHVYATLARFATPNGLHLFPKPGHAIDTEIHGKRLLMDLPSLEITR